MKELAEIHIEAVEHLCHPPSVKVDRRVKWLQGITLDWMVVECAGAIAAAG